MFKLFHSDTEVGSDFSFQDNDLSFEERVQISCCGILLFFATIAISLFCCIVFSSCASHKDTTSTTQEKKDTVSVMLTDAVNKTIERKDSSYIAWEDTSHEVCGITESMSDAEIITEYIVEQSDSSGNRTVTTNRTINRKSSADKQTTSEQWQRHQEEQTALLLSLLDSIANSRKGVYATHYEHNDSTHEDRQQSANNPVSWYESALIRIGGLVLLVSVILGIIMICRKIK